RRGQAERQLEGGGGQRGADGARASHDCWQLGSATEPNPARRTMNRNSGLVAIPTVARKWTRPSGGGSSAPPVPRARRVVTNAATAAASPSTAIGAATMGAARTPTTR